MSSSEYKETRLFGLGALAIVIRWFTEFLILANILLLMVGSTIAATDLLTNGALSHISTKFDLVWGASQAVTIEVLFITAFVRAARCGRQGRYWAMLGWILVGGILAVPTVQASLVYSMTRTLGISTAQALSTLHLPVFTWLLTRSILVAFVGALDGWASYSPEEHRKSVAERVRELEENARIAEAKGRLNQVRAKAMIGAARTAAKAAFGREDEPEGDDTDPKSLSGALDNAGEASAQEGARKRGKHRRVYSIAEARRLQRAKEAGSAQNRVYEFLSRHPNAPLSQIMEATGVGKATASKYKRSFRERQVGVRATQ
jgi:hypothetical protein